MILGGRKRFLAGLLAANAAFLWHNAFRTYQAFDMNIFLDGAWRIVSGQKPYVDFIIATGPVHYYLLAVFCKALGFGKTAIWAHLVFVHSAVILATWCMVRKRAGVLAAMLAAFLSTTCFYWSVSFPWYSQSAHLWGILAAAFLACRLPFTDAAAARRAGFFCGLMAAFSILTKQNIGAAYVVVFAAVLGVSVFRWQALLVFLAGLVTGSVLVTAFLIPSLPAFMDQVMGASAFRMYLFEHFIGSPAIWFFNYYWIAALVVAANLAVASKRPWPLAALFFGLWFVGVFSMGTSGSVYKADVPLLGIFMGVAFILVGDGAGNENAEWKRKFKRISFWILAATTLALTALYARYGIELKGWSKPYFSKFQGVDINQTGDYPLKAAKLQGWLMDREQGEALDGLVEYFNGRVSPKDSVLILTDLQVFYALTGRQSFKGVTLAFVDWGWPTPGKMRDEVRENILKKPPLWIVTHENRVPFAMYVLKYLGLEDELRLHYAVVHQFGNYRLLRRKWSLQGGWTPEALNAILAVREHH